MRRFRVIPIFLLSLLVVINWHNSFLHFHADTDPENSDYVHEHHHHHGHSHGHHHGTVSFWDFLKNVLGDFDHPDLGETHFEEFLKPGNQLLTDSEYQPILQVSGIVPISFGSVENPEIQRPDNSLINKDFSDPPFLETLSVRGPPLS